jgi:hypothetical protein
MGRDGRALRLGAGGLDGIDWNEWNRQQRADACNVGAVRPPAALARDTPSSRRPKTCADPDTRRRPRSLRHTRPEVQSSRFASESHGDTRLTLRNASPEKNINWIPEVVSLIWSSNKIATGTAPAGELLLSQIQELDAKRRSPLGVVKRSAAGTETPVGAGAV